MYNKLLLKDRKTGLVSHAFHGNLVGAVVKLRIDNYDDPNTGNRDEYEFDVKEVEEMVEYLSEFLRLLESSR